MKEPKRLLSQGATDFERQLLRAVVNERPSALLRSRMQRGLGLVGPLAWASTVRAMLGGVVGNVSRGGVAAKVTGVVALGVLATAGVTAFSLVPSSSSHGPAALSVPAPVTEPVNEVEPVIAEAPEVAAGDVPSEVGASGAEAAARVEPVPEATTPPSHSPEAVASVGVAPKSSAPEAQAPEATAPETVDDDRQLREEIALLDAARGALERGDRQAARDSLRSYRERFPSGILAREANVLRRRAEPPRARPRPER